MSKAMAVTGFDGKKTHIWLGKRKRDKWEHAKWSTYVLVSTGTVPGGSVMGYIGETPDVEARLHDHKSKREPTTAGLAPGWSLVFKATFTLSAQEQAAEPIEATGPPPHWRAAKLLEEAATNSSWHRSECNLLHSMHLPLDAGADSKTLWPGSLLQQKITNIARLLQLPALQACAPEVTVGPCKAAAVRRWLAAEGVMPHVPPCSTAEAAEAAQDRDTEDLLEQSQSAAQEGAAAGPTVLSKTINSFNLQKYLVQGGHEAYRKRLEHVLQLLAGSVITVPTEGQVFKLDQVREAVAAAQKAAGGEKVFLEGRAVSCGLPGYWERDSDDAGVVCIGGPRI